jgi:hypothetical protein
MTSRTTNVKHEEIVEDVLQATAEINRRDGRPHCLAFATRCEDAIAAHRRRGEDLDLMRQYLADHGLVWPPPEAWMPGYSTPEED